MRYALAAFVREAFCALAELTALILFLCALIALFNR